MMDDAYRRLTTPAGRDTNASVRARINATSNGLGINWDKIRGIQSGLNLNTNLNINFRFDISADDSPIMETVIVNGYRHHTTLAGRVAEYTADLLSQLPDLPQIVLDSVTNSETGERSFQVTEFIAGELKQIPFSEVGSIFGSNLARLIGTSDPWAGLAIGTVLGTLGMEIGQAIDASNGNITREMLRDELRQVGVEDHLEDAGAGAVSSYLFAQLVNISGIQGFAGEATSSIGGAVISKIAYNLLHPTEFYLNQTTHQLECLQWDTGVNADFLANAAGSFLGSYLAGQLVHFNTIEGQVGASLGSAIGALYLGPAIAGVLEGGELGFKIGASFGGPIGALIGAFIGFIVGGLIGSMFAGTPRSGAELSWNGKEFQVGNSWSHRAGSDEAARSLAGTATETLNSVLSATGSTLLNPNSVRTGTYGMRKSSYVYWAPGTDSAMKSDNLATYDNAGGLITHGTYIALSDMAGQLAGGDVYVKRALASTLTATGGNSASLAAGSEGQFNSDTLLGNITVAQDYEQYLQNTAMINALIAAEPNSTFTATWLVTIAQAEDIGLNKRAYTDWIGGWNVFLDESMGGAIDGTAFTPANLSLQLDPDTSERSFLFADSDGYLLGSFGDTIDTAGKTKVTATSGADTITVGGTKGDTIANTTGLTIDGTAGDGTAKTIRVAAVIDAGDGDDVVNAGDLGNDVLGGAGNDTLVGGKLDDWLFGGEGNDRLFAGGSGTGLNTNFADTDTAAINAALAADGGNGNYLSGDAGDDRLYGGKGSDWLAGGTGNDKLYGAAGGDILDGGAGTDTEQGGDGSDQYVFNLGDGVDTIFDSSDPLATPGVGVSSLRGYVSTISSGWLQRNWAGSGNYTVDGSVVGGEDAIAFGVGISMVNLRLSRSGNDLVINFVTWNAEYTTPTATTDQLTVKDWYDTRRQVEWFRFADGEDIRVSDFLSYSVTTGTSGSDNLIGTNGNDFIFGLAGNDSIRLLSGSDFGYGGSGDDFNFGLAEDDNIPAARGCVANENYSAQHHAIGGS
jgi:Ca2+-binding RTX toxin-like protein